MARGRRAGRGGPSGAEEERAGGGRPLFPPHRLPRAHLRRRAGTRRAPAPSLPRSQPGARTRPARARAGGAHLRCALSFPPRAPPPRARRRPRWRLEGTAATPPCLLLLLPSSILPPSRRGTAQVIRRWGCVGICLCVSVCLCGVRVEFVSSRRISPCSPPSPGGVSSLGVDERYSACPAPSPSCPLPPCPIEPRAGIISGCGLAGFAPPAAAPTPNCGAWSGLWLLYGLPPVPPSLGRLP